jgi:hypothetical protein
LLVDLEATLNVSPRTHLGALYLRDLAYSALTIAGETPTLQVENLGLRLDKEIVGPLDLKLRLLRSRLVTDGKLRVVNANGALEATRDDTTWQASADLGVRIRQHLRVGVVATYTDRQSSIADFGVAGLLLGASLSYTP